MLRLALASLLLLVCLAPLMQAAAQSYSDALDAFERFAAQVDRAHSESAPTAVSTLLRLRAGWQRLHQTDLGCLTPAEINGEPVRFQVIGPFERQDGLDFAVLSRGFAATWDDGAQATSLLLSQRFDARAGEPVGELFLEGGYHSSPNAPPTGIVAADRWVDVPGASSSPPIHQPWGQYQTVLVRRIGSCRLP